MRGGENHLDAPRPHPDAPAGHHPGGSESGGIIEEYPQDYPYPSCLLLHVLEKPLHVVCGAGDGQLWIITVYRPDPSQWETDFATRKESLQ